MKAEEILDKIETQLEQALDCYNKASFCGSDPDLEKKKYHAQQLLGLVRTLRAEDRFLPLASRFKQVSEIAMDVEIEAAKERNEQLRKEIERIGREQTKVKYANHYAQHVCGGNDEYAATNYISGWNDADFTMLGKLKRLLLNLRGVVINDAFIEHIIKKLTE